jgi:glycosyltransferase involved in cell wall biosynthesis
MQDKSKLLVSVCIITYNHEKYIRECLDSVISQKTNFDFNIIVSDDCSSDRTLEVLKEYASKHPNLEIVSRCGLPKSFFNGKPTGNMNFIETLKKATGEYIAYCDGDDVWASSTKLQSQIDVLQSSSDVALVCSTKNQIVNGSLVEKKSLFPDIKFSYLWLCFYNPIPASSVAFRRSSFVEPPTWYMDKLDIGDWPLWFLITYKKKIYKFNSSLLNYRVHPSGLWSKKKSSDKVIAYLDTIFYLNSYHNHILLRLSHLLHFARYKVTKFYELIRGIK